MMMSWLLATMLVSMPASADRVPVSCSTSSTTAGLVSGARAVTAIECDRRRGFFVPSLRYRELSAADIAVDSFRDETKLHDRHVAELELALTQRTFSATTSAASVVRLERKLETRDVELAQARQDVAEASHSLFLAGVLGFAAGAGAVLGSALILFAVSK